MDKLNIDVSERLPLTDLLALPHLKEPLTSKPDFDGSVANSIKVCLLLGRTTFLWRCRQVVDVTAGSE